MSFQKNLFLVFLFSFYAFTCSSQQDEEKVDVNNYLIEYLNLSYPIHRLALPFPVSDILVYDTRFDTSCVGIPAKLAVANHLTLLKFREGLADEAKLYYDSLIEFAPQTNENGILYCFIKTLMLSDHIYTSYSEEERISSKEYDKQEMSGIRFMAEYYYKKDDSFIPVCRFDTTITGMKQILKASASHYIEDALTTGINKVARCDWNKIAAQGKKLTIEEINNYNITRFSLPVLTAQPVKGIYYSFHDFINNTPSADDFVVEKNRTGDYLYLKGKTGENKLLIELWGYCDGKDKYIFSANNYFKLHRAGNGFKIYGAKNFTAKRNLRANFGVVDIISPNSNYSKGQTANKYYLIKSYLLLDMEKGELF